jgi:hypothetical protein
MKITDLTKIIQEQIELADDLISSNFKNKEYEKSYKHAIRKDILSDILIEIKEFEKNEN